MAAKMKQKPTSVLVPETIKRRVLSKAQRDPALRPRGEPEVSLSAVVRHLFRAYLEA